jgi:hypothetical protein
MGGNPTICMAPVPISYEVAKAGRKAEVGWEGREMVTSTLS